MLNLSRSHPSTILVLTLAMYGMLPTAAAQIPNAQQSPPPGAGFRIAGTVANSVGGNPLSRARVTIFDASNPQNSQWMISLEDGHFEFKQLGAGKYTLRGAKRGFIPADYQQHEQFSTAIVTGAGLDTENLVLRLAPTAVLSGKVLDESGDPVRRATVSLYAEDRRVGVGRIQEIRQEATDDQGSYEFTPLNAGTYFLSATATPWYAVHAISYRQQGEGNTPTAVDPSLDVAYPVTYYHDATEPDEASPIPIRGGDHLEADIHLNPVPALHLLFHVPGNGERGFNLPTLQEPAFNGVNYVPITGGRMVSPGLFELTGVAAGRYTVRTLVSPPGDPDAHWSEVEMDLAANDEELDMSKGKPAGTVEASVKVMGEETLPRELLVLLRNSKLRVVAGQNVNGKGEVDFGDVTPGKYEVLVQSSTKAYSVAKISSNGSEVPGHMLNVAAGQSLTVALSLVVGTANVEGFVKQNGKAVAGAMVVLVPKDPKLNRELFRRDQSDMDGSFSLRSVIPGAYFVCAIEDGWDLDWGKTAVIGHYCEHGQQVVVRGQVAGSVHLPDMVEVRSR
jgi:hypothetical protein